MKRSLGFSYMIVGFLLLSLSKPAASMSEISVSIKTPKELASDNSDPNSPANSDQLNIRTLLAPKGTDMHEMVETLRQAIAELRESNPDLGPIEMVVMSQADGDEGGIKLANMIQENIEDITLFTLNHTDEFEKYVAVPEEDIFEEIAVSRLFKFLTIMSNVRFVGTAAVTMGVSILIGDLPVVPSIVGGLTAGLLSRRLHKENHDLNKFIGRNPIWDKDGDLHRSGKFRWRAARWLWDTFGKHGTLIAGYLTTVHWAMALAGGPASYLANPMEWVAYTWLFGGLSAASSGAWKRLDAKIYLEKLKANKIKYFADHGKGISNAIKLVGTSSVATLMMSLSSVFCESFRLSSDMLWYTATAMTINGALGWTSYYLKTRTKVFDWASEKTEPARIKAKNSSKKFYDKYLSRYFSKDPCYKAFNRPTSL